MMKTNVSLSDTQWEFIAILHQFQTVVSLHLLGRICPLSPDEFVPVMETALSLQWINKTKNNLYAISKELPLEIEEKLEKLNASRLINKALHKLAPAPLVFPVDQAAIADYLYRQGDLEFAAQMQSELIRYYIEKGRYSRAMVYLERSLSILTRVEKNEKTNNLYGKNVLRLLDITFALGKDFDSLPSLMKLTQEAIIRAKENGNRRLSAMAHLHLGRLQLFAEDRTGALDNLSAGLRAIEELGDEDSRSQAAGFIGLYYYLQGNFFQAIEYLEEASRDLRIGRKEIIDPCSCVLLGYSASYIGQLSLAIGSLDCNWRIAIEKKNTAAACTIRTTMGTVLLLMGKNQEGYKHLQEAVTEAENTKNSLALYFGRAGLALYHFLEKRYLEAYDFISLNLCKGIDSGKGMLSLLSSPWVLEMICEASLRGVHIKIPGFNFPLALQKIIDSPNIHMKGVALRIQAQLGAGNEAPPFDILALLKESENYLSTSGDHVQLAKTRVEKVRWYIRDNKLDKAREIAYQARKGLSGYADSSYPDNLRYLLEGFDPTSVKNIDHHSTLRLFLEMLDELIPNPEFDNILTNMVRATNRFFSGERGGLFWFKKERGEPTLKSAHNLTKSDITANRFRPNLNIIKKAFSSNQPISIRIDKKETGLSTDQSVLCIPFRIRNNEGGVLYHDNLYLDGYFKLFEAGQLKLISNHITSFVERLTMQQEVRRTNKNLLTREYTSPNTKHSKSGIIFNSLSMKQLLEQAERVAKTDASILILGETGVGKGVLAQWIQKRSLRSDMPLVTVDLTTLPENLVESELFGYEKGAFTGAESQKVGRLELADKGTLFLDEIGEITKPVQAKLLSVMQDKSFIRIGGTRNIQSNFRLLAATNRNLTDDILTGAFRSDLLYRINTITLTIPPLRERREDILPLAAHFFAYYCKKHNRQGLTVGRSEEEKLLEYHWPGNIRELEHLIESSVLLSTGNRLEINISPQFELHQHNPFCNKPPLDELQKQYIEYILAETKGKVGGPGGAAEVLGISRTTLNARMKKLQITPHKFKQLGCTVCS